MRRFLHHLLCGVSLVSTVVAAAGFVLGRAPVPPTAQGKPPAPRFVVNHQREVVSAEFSPDGRILAAGAGYAGIILWDAASGKEIRRIEGETVGDMLSFSPDGKILAAVRNWQQGKAGGVIQLWDVATGKLGRTIQGDNTLIRCVAFAPDGKLLAAHSQFGGVGVWEVASGKEVLRIPTASAGHTVAFSPDGKLLAFDVEYTVRLCEVATGKELFKLAGHQMVIKGGAITSGYVNALAFSPDGKRLATASCDNMTRVWDVATGKALHVLEGHKGFVNAVRFLPDGKLIATGGEDGTIRLWEAATGKQVLAIPAHERSKLQTTDERKDVFALALSPDGKRLASGGRDTAVKVWDVIGLLDRTQP
jgi:WD40 repeat protein